MPLHLLLCARSCRKRDKCWRIFWICNLLSKSFRQ